MDDRSSHVEQLSCGDGLYLASSNKVKVFDNPFNAEYLRRLKNREPEIENHFHSYFAPRLKAKLRGRRLQESDARDLVSETFVRVLNAIDHDEIHSPVAFGGYVSRVCDFVIYNFFNDHQLCDNRFYVALHEIDIPDPNPDIETVILRKERQKQVAMILNDLSLKDRNLLRAKLCEELTSEEMCARFGASSPDRLRVMLHRARKRFEKACRKRGLNFKQRSEQN